MKRIVCTTLVLLALAAPRLPAQDITIGVKGGLNVADVSTDIPDIEDIKASKTGFVGGAYANFALGGVFAIQPEVLYSQKGFKGEDSGLPGVSADFKFNYFEIPLLLKAQFPMEMVRPAVYAGPVVSFETSCKLGLSEGDISADFDCDSEEAGASDRKKTEFGGVFGANLDLFVGPVVLTVDGRYQLGFTNLNDDPADAETASLKNRVWQFMAGVGFPI